MNRDYTLVPADMPQLPLFPGTIAARKGILKHEFDEEELNRAYWEWDRGCWERARADATDYSHFLNGAVADCLTTGRTENKVLSPFSVFHALVAMAALTAGETRREVLAVLGLPDSASAETAMNLQYLANFAQGGMTVRPSAMLWLDERVEADESALRALASRIFVGTSRGLMSDADYQRAMARWLREVTGGTFDERGKGLAIDARTRLMLLTSLALRDKWAHEFNPSRTEAGIFRANEGAIRVPYMRKTLNTGILLRDAFAAVPLLFEGYNMLWLVLPREGVAPETLLRERFFTAFPPGPRQTVEREVHLSVPRFDISREVALMAPLKGLGIRRLFSDASQTPCLNIDGRSLKVDRVTHGARLRIDEKGCEASAYTALPCVVCAGLPKTPPRYDFILDRPFLFVLMGRGELPLFAGIVHRPETI